MKKWLLLSVAIFFTPHLFAANVVYVGDDDQKEGFNSSTQLQKQTVHDYTILKDENVNHTIDDIEDAEEDLEDNLLAVSRKLITIDNQSTPLLFGAVLQHNKNHKHYQYLITNTGLLSKSTQPNAVKKAHKKGFHLIQAFHGHVSLQLLAWLQVSEHYTVIALHTNKPVCRNCSLIARSLWKKKLETNEKGCFNISFPPLNKMPALAYRYINTHLNLSLVQSFIVPMMGYVSKEEQKKAIQQKNKKLAEKNYEISLKDNLLNVKTNLVNVLERSLKEKNRNIDNNRCYLLSGIATKLDRLHNEFKISLNYSWIKNIEDENGVKSFVEEVRLAAKEGLKQLEEDIEILRRWHALYKGDCWRFFREKDPYDDKDRLYKNQTTYDYTYFGINKKINDALRNAEKGAIFSSILQSLKILLPINQAQLWGVNDVLKEIGFKNEDYRLEITRLRDKLEQEIPINHTTPRFRWRA